LGAFAGGDCKKKVEDSVEPWAVKASAFLPPEKNLALQEK